MKKILEIYCDGSCWNGQPEQPMGLGIAYFLDNVHLEKYDKAIEITWETAGKYTTSVLAELVAIQLGIERLTEITEKYDEVIINSDNEFSIKIFENRSTTSLAHLVKTIENTKKLIKPNFTFNWVPREKNAVANKLSRKALGKELLDKDKVFIKKTK